MSASPSDEPFTLEGLDTDEALQEANANVQGDSRAAFFRKSGAFVGGGLLAGGLPAAIAAGQGGGIPRSDIDILNFALTLEYLESSFYAEAVSKGKLNGELAKFASVVSGHESAHVAALQKALGSKAVKKPKFDFKGTTGDAKMFAKTSMALEDTGVTAYEGQAPNIKTPAVLMAAGSILPVEARHASWVRDIIGRGKDPRPAPDAFNPAKTMSEVLAVVKGTGFIKS